MKFENGDECGEIYEVTDEAMEWLRRIDALDPQTVVYDDEYNWHTEDKDGKITGVGVSTPKRPSNPFAWMDSSSKGINDWKEQHREELCPPENIAEDK